MNISYKKEFFALYYIYKEQYIPVISKNICRTKNMLIAHIFVRTVDHLSIGYNKLNEMCISDT